MRKFYRNDKIKFNIGDVRDIPSVKNAMHDVDYIFHAAALKQDHLVNFSRWKLSKLILLVLTMYLQLQSSVE